MGKSASFCNIIYRIDELIGFFKKKPAVGGNWVKLETFNGDQKNISRDAIKKRFL
jgi:hypothetical protein